MTELPTGTVTFLFTDLEGSTRLWELHPEAMTQVLARHDAILRDAIELHGGHVVKTTGDGIHAAFATAHDAVVAAIDGQRVLIDERWEPEPLRVRMGIHTGESDMRDGDYYGPAVNRAARLMSLAHGGQILISRATEELLHDALSDGIELRDLGEHRLRDLSRAERIFQVEAPGLREDFASLRSVDSYPGNLPLQVTSFVGRDDDLAILAKAVEENRLVTLTGTGGMGKTRLATQLAAELVPRFADGAWLCELAPAPDHHAMLQIVAAVLGVQERRSMTLAASVVDFLGPKRLLLVLDNCEHVLAGASALAASILRSCQHVRVVATSRTALDVAGEQQWPVRPLAVPGATTPPAGLNETAAGRLFLERAWAARPGFIVDDQNVEAVAEICRRLDGMPLALELAAARVSALGPAEIVSLLDERFRLLTGGHREERHHTLAAAVDWSYSLLGPVEQRVFDRLGVFAGSFDADAARAVTGGDGIEAFDVVEALAHLVEQSMVSAEPEREGAMRYELLETLRQYALERLGEETPRWQRRHAEHYLDFATEAGNGLLTREELAWRARLGRELDNIRAAFMRSLESTDAVHAEIASRLVAQLSFLTTSLPGWRVGDWAEQVIERGVFPDDTTRFMVYGTAAQAAVTQGSYSRAGELAREATRNGLPPDANVGHNAYIALGTHLAVAGRFEESMQVYEEASAAFAADDLNPVGRLIIESTAAMTEAAYGRMASARSRAQRNLPEARAIGNPSALAETLVALGWSQLDSNPDAALTALDEAIDIGPDATDVGSRWIALSMVAPLRCRIGDASGAISALRESVQVTADSGDRGLLVTALERSVAVLVEVGQPGTAAVIGGVAKGSFARVGHLPPNERSVLQEALTSASAQLGERKYNELTARGSSMSLDELVIYALTELDRTLENLGDD
jgi:predicted ATPase/class 3 adenylate cyclase